MDKKVCDLVFLARGGNAEAFGELYNMYAKEMYCYACAMVKNQDLAQDAVQDAAMTAFREIGSLRNIESFKGWLFRILNVSCRKQYNASMAALPIIDEMNYDEDSDMTCTDEIGNADLSMELKDALSILTEEERNIVMMRVICEYGSQEMAAIIGIPDSTVRSKLKRSLEKLRNYMGSREFAAAV